jgi:hypothetical protein
MMLTLKIKKNFPYNYENKNIVLITSKIIISSNKFSYCKSRSIYTNEERLNQTIHTIKSIRQYIPNSYIVLVDNSVFNESVYRYLSNITDYFINITQNTRLNYFTDICIYKALAEISHQLCFYEHFIKKININKIKNLFKISGRYFINETFNYLVYDNNYNIFKTNKKVKDRGEYCYTSFYKLNKTIIPHYFNSLRTLDEVYVSKLQWNDLEVIIPPIIKNKVLVENLGITQLISVWKEKSDI